MFTVTINEKAGQQSKLEFYKNDVTIGRMKGNDIVLPRTNISKIHATLKLRGDHFMVQDHNSTNGTFVNGVRITGEATLGSDDMVYVGEFVFQLEKGLGRGGTAPAPPPPPSAPAPTPAPQAPRKGSRGSDTTPSLTPTTARAPARQAAASETPWARCPRILENCVPGRPMSPLDAITKPSRSSPTPQPQPPPSPRPLAPQSP